MLCSPLYSVNFNISVARMKTITGHLSLSVFMRHWNCFFLSLSSVLISAVGWANQEQDFGQENGSIKSKVVMFTTSVRTLLRGKGCLAPSHWMLNAVLVTANTCMINVETVFEYSFTDGVVYNLCLLGCFCVESVASIHSLTGSRCEVVFFILSPVCNHKSMNSSTSNSPFQDAHSPLQCL